MDTEWALHSTCSALPNEGTDKTPKINQPGSEPPTSHQERSPVAERMVPLPSALRRRLATSTRGTREGRTRPRRWTHPRFGALGPPAHSLVQRIEGLPGRARGGRGTLSSDGVRFCRRWAWKMSVGQVPVVSANHRFTCLKRGSCFM